jgi:hypothetical protein
VTTANKDRESGQLPVGGAHFGLSAELSRGFGGESALDRRVSVGEQAGRHLMAINEYRLNTELQRVDFERLDDGDVLVDNGRMSDVVDEIRRALMYDVNRELLQFVYAQKPKAASCVLMNDGRLIALDQDGNRLFTVHPEVFSPDVENSTIRVTRKVERHV